METYGLEQLGIISPSAVYRNLSLPFWWRRRWPGARAS